MKAATRPKNSFFFVDFTAFLDLLQERSSGLSNQVVKLQATRIGCRFLRKKVSSSFSFLSILIIISIEKFHSL